jgi:cysteine desulfurase
MSYALQAADAARERASAHCLRLSIRLINGITERVDDAQLNGLASNRLPNNVNFTFAGVEAESLLMGLDLAGIAASSGSACTAASLEASHVLLALGMPDNMARSSLRLTTGLENTEEEIDHVVDAVAGLVGKIRAVARHNPR